MCNWLPAFRSRGVLRQRGDAGRISCGDCQSPLARASSPIICWRELHMRLPVSKPNSRYKASGLSSCCRVALLFPRYQLLGNRQQTSTTPAALESSLEVLPLTPNLSPLCPTPTRRHSCQRITACTSSRCCWYTRLGTLKPESRRTIHIVQL